MSWPLYYEYSRPADVLDDQADSWLRACGCCYHGRKRFEEMTLRQAWREANDCERAVFVDNLLLAAHPSRLWLELMHATLELFKNVVSEPMIFRRTQLRVQADAYERELWNRWHAVMRAAA